MRCARGSLFILQKDVNVNILLFYVDSNITSFRISSLLHPQMLLLVCKLADQRTPPAAKKSAIWANEASGGSRDLHAVSK